MSSAPLVADPRMTIEEFLAFADSRPEPERWELVNGRPMMMTGSNFRHSTIVSAFAGALMTRVAGSGCRVLWDMFVRSEVRDDQLFVPDLFVKCGGADPLRRMMEDAVLVVEVLSRSTYLKDRGLKLERYVEFPTIEQVILVYQDRPRIESWVRTDGKWADEPIELESLDATLDLPRFAATIPVAEIYGDALDAA